MGLNDEYQIVEETQETPKEAVSVAYEEMDKPRPSINVSALFERLKTPTGDGELNDYMSGHLFNPNASKGKAHILRGLTGFFGSLNYAFVDILLGIVSLRGEKAEHAGVGGYVKNYSSISGSIGND